MASVNQGITICLDGQLKIDPAQGVVGNPSSAHGSYTPIYAVGLTGRDDRGATAQPKDPAPLPFTVPTPLLGPPTYYSMRRTDTGAVGGYAHWVNTTGTSAGAPAAIGVVGPPQILAVYT